jgi:hypothetical protein
LIVDSIAKLRGTGVNIRLVVIAVQAAMQAGRGPRRPVPIPIPVLANGAILSTTFTAPVQAACKGNCAAERNKEQDL